MSLLKTPQLQTQFSELERLWYRRLRESGFLDIENLSCPDRSLIVYHSHHFLRESTRLVKEKRTPYQVSIDAFANDPQFPEIVLLMVRHGNSKFTSNGIESIWELHRSGHSERDIAGRMQCSRSCITFILRRMREWMKLIL